MTQGSPDRLSRGAHARARKTLLAAAFSLALLAFAPALRAQTATISGALSNFDVVNNTGHDAHGFEIQFEGLQPADVNTTFTVLRYGAPQIVPYATGVYVRWSSPYDATAGQFTQTTTPHAANTPFAGMCYQWSGAGYATSGCEHFGVTLNANATQTIFRWLVEDAQNPGTLVAVNPPVAIPLVNYFVLPPAQVGAAPVLEAQFEAPVPAEAPELYGDAQWVKVFKTELPREVNLNELVSDNTVVPQDASETEVAWEIVQQEPAGAADGGTRRRRQNQGGLNASTRSVVRRYEIYQFTGTYDPATHQALCADGLCTAPATNEVGDFIGAQMTAANVAVPSITVANIGNGTISSTDKNISCGTKCVSYYNAGATVTLQARAGSGSVFTGWGGACSGSQSTCTVTLNDAQTVTANFAQMLTFSVSTSGKGSVTCANGAPCSSKVLQGTTLTLTATPSTGFHFSNWTGACSGTAPTCDLSVIKNSQVQAVFLKN
jgi:hypothetical protein